MTAATPPLLVAMAGGRPRLRRARIPVPRESKLHVDVAKLLRKHCLPGWKWRHINAKAMDAREGAIMKRMGVNPGWPDFVLFGPEAFPHFLELKRPGEELTDEQEEFQYWACRALHASYAVARTIDQVLATFEAWECLRIKSIPRRGGEA
jgi:hypothetical protein